MESIRKKGWVAILLSLLFMGTGFMYIRRPKYAAVSLSILIALGIVLRFIALTPIVLFVGYGFVLLYILTIAVWSGRLAGSGEFSGRFWSDRWYTIVGYILGMGLLLTQLFLSKPFPTPFIGAIKFFNIPTVSNVPTLVSGDGVVAHLTSSVDRHDFLVFQDPTGIYSMVFRVVGMPGDTLEIKENRVLVNGSPADVATENLSFQYQVAPTAGKVLNPDFWERNGIDPMSAFAFPGGYIIHVTEGEAGNLGQNSNWVAGIDKMLQEPGSPHQFGDWPWLKEWNPHHFGPLWIPKQGGTIPLEDTSWLKFGTTILEESPQLQKGTAQGQQANLPVQEYTFKENYYFVLGDSRDNAMDSRYIGLVPTSRIVGVLRYRYSAKELSRVGDLLK